MSRESRVVSEPKPDGEAKDAQVGAGGFAAGTRNRSAQRKSREAEEHARDEQAAIDRAHREP